MNEKAEVIRTADNSQSATPDENDSRETHLRRSTEVSSDNAVSDALCSKVGS